MSNLIELEQVACPLCGSAESGLYVTGCDFHYDLSGEFQLVRCRACRHVYMNPRPTLQTIAHCYPGSYVPHQRSCSAESKTEPPGEAGHAAWYLSPAVRRIPGLRQLYYWLADSKSEVVPTVASHRRRALEIGCATGDFIVRLQELGWTAQGVELDEQAALRAQERGLEVHPGTLESVSLPDDSFDAAFAWMVVEHLPDPKSTLREIHRVLKPDGWFMFSVPNFGCWEPRVFGRYWDALDLPRHLQHFTAKSLKRLLDETGFEYVRIIHQRNLLNVVGSLGIWLHNHFPNSRLAQGLKRFCHNPTMWPQLALAFPAKFLALLRQGGRLTVVARRREQPPPQTRPSS